MYELARSLVVKGKEPIPRIVNSEPVSYSEGRRDTFWITDQGDISVSNEEFELRLVTPSAYWYVQVGQNLSTADLEDAAADFEETIRPRVAAAMGEEWTPGVDNDVHLNIVHGALSGGVLGQFSSVDEYPVSVQPFSNQREVIYLNSRNLRVGDRFYLATLAHEYQHAVHWNADPTEETWVNEGLSELATELSGIQPLHGRSVLRSPTPSLIHWPTFISPFYGQALMFFQYLTSQYGDPNDLRPLMTEPADGLAGIDGFLVNVGSEKGFEDVYREWLVANLLDESGRGPYSFPGRSVEVEVSGRMGRSDSWESDLAQYSAEYVEVESAERAVIVEFQGQAQTPLFPVEIGPQGCWWSNGGDSISSSLTRELDLSGVSSATLGYRLWYDLEENWDYAYLEVSRDGGSTWDIIPTPRSSPGNPVGNSFGPGYTGETDGWIKENVDLSDYAGERVLLRFHYVTDDAINDAGLCVYDISVPEIGYNDETQGLDGWTAEGFVRVEDFVPQQFFVQVVEVGPENRVTLMALDDNNRGNVTLPERDDREGIVVIVAALAPGTLLETSYTLTTQAGPPS